MMAVTPPGNVKQESAAIGRTLAVGEVVRIRTGKRAFDINTDADGSLHVWVVGSGRAAVRGDGTRSGFVVFIIGTE
jgi:hypothetical protein